MDLKKQFWVVMLIASLILVFVFSQENGFTFILSHTYEIGSVRKPRQMHWKTPNWEMIVPFVTTIASLAYFIVLSNKNQHRP